VTIVVELLVTVDEEAPDIALDLRKGSTSLGGKWRKIWTVRDELNRVAKLGVR
jgi:hypothetical protein